MAEDLVGRRLRGGEYELRAVLGRGGMATVYRAYARSLDTDVAVKILSPRLANSPLFRARFRDEARSLAQLHHPNLVEVHHYGEEGDLVYIVMRLVAGGTLKDRLAALDGPLDLVSTARLIGQVADALQAAHERGLVHLDIKPANILLGRADWPLLADFGITRAIGRERSASGQERYAGTPLYMSPEQCRGDPLDGRSDEYSLAVTTYELLVGTRPFTGETTEAVLDAHLNLPPPPPRSRNPGIPGPVEAVILRGLAKQADERYPSVAEYARALREAVEQTRGVALETKQAAAEAAPNLVGALGLILLGPLLLGLLPAGPLPGSRIPPGWIVQTVLALLIGVLYLGVRWHLIGLTERALAGLLGSVLGPAAGPDTAWRRGLIGAVEGIVNLGYLFGLTWLISRPALALLGAATTPAIAASAGTALTLAVIIAALALIVRLYRASGPGAAALVLGAAWVMAAALPGGDIRPGVGPGAAWIARALGAAGVLVLALVARPRTRATLQQVLSRAASPILAALHPAEGPGEAAAERAWLQGLIGDVLDFGYLLLGYGLLHQPANDLLGLALGPLPAAILVTGLAGLPWLLLTVRLGRVAGRLGVALGVLLGAPLLLTLPILDAGLLGARWPVTIATWGVGTAAVLLLVLIRGQVQDLGRRALGPVLERRVLGTTTAASEEEGASWLGTVGGLIGAALDAALLILVYWLLGVPAAAALDRARQDTAGGEIVLLLFLAGIIAILARPLWNLLALLAGVHGRPGQAGRAWPVLATALIALLATSCAATPVILAAPASVGALAPETALAGRDVVVTWQYWQPAVPSPELATYNLALSCSDGEPLGWFREAVHPAPGRAMPAGPAGPIGRIAVSCDDWQRAYLEIRQTAGLPAAPSASWGWLDIQIQIGPDGSAAVTETHHLLVTSGELDHLTWELDGQPARLTVQDEEGEIPLGVGSGPRRARLTTEGGHTRLTVWFPAVNAPATRTLVVSYWLADALQTVGGARRFERVILEPERDGPTWRTTIRITLPPSLAVGPLRPGTRGWSARSGLLDGRTAWFEADDVPATGSLAVSLEIGGPTSTPSPVPASPTPTPTETPTATETAVPTATPSPTATAVLRAALPAATVPATAPPPPTPTPVAY
ncbi:MAG: serine/threonine protein kinase, partial [Chloroflexi bacterium]|nr:serine/threonine protein kinase [Chloroflexota bacterium]